MLMLSIENSTHYKFYACYMYYTHSILSHCWAL